MFKQIRLVSIITLGILFSLPTVSQAATLSPAPNYTIGCKGITQNTAGAQVTFDRNTSGAGTDTIVYHVTDGDGTVIYNFVDTEPLTTTRVLTSFSYAIAPDFNPIRFRIINPAGNGLPEQVLLDISGNCISVPSAPPASPVASNQSNSAPADVFMPASPQITVSIGNLGIQT